MLFGSVMHLLVHVIMTGEPGENLARLWRMIKDKYQEFGTEHRCGTMKMTMFSPGGGAKLRGTAAQIRGWDMVARGVHKKPNSQRR